jgi:hypothetical protein
MRWLAVFVLLISTPSFAWNPCVHDIDGNKFVCWNEKEAQDLLRIVVEFPKLQDQLKIMNDMNLNLQLQISEEKEMNDNLKQQILQYENINVKLQAKLNASNHWYNSKVLWTAVGLVLGVGVTIGISFAVK